MSEYYFRFREQDGDWSPWQRCSRSRYMELLDADDAEVYSIGESSDAQ